MKIECFAPPKETIPVDTTAWKPQYGTTFREIFPYDNDPEYEMEMIKKQADGAGRAARSIYEDGEKHFAQYGFLEKGEIPTLDKARANSFAFAQVWGKKGGYSSTVACMSNFYPWHRRQVGDMANVGQEIIQNIALENVQIYHYGEGKMVAFVETDDEPITLIERWGDAPKDPYAKYFPELSGVVNQIQDIRKQRDLDPLDGNARGFLETFYNKTNGIKRAFKKNGENSFQWGLEERKDGKLYGVNLDGVDQDMNRITEEATVEDTKKILHDITGFLKGQRMKNRYVIQFDFFKDVSCCNLATNAQSVEEIYIRQAIFGLPAVIFDKKLICKKGHAKEECDCNDVVELAPGE